MQSYFYELTDYLEACLPAGREYNAYLDAEDSAFVRLTEGAVRQSGMVFQRYLWLDVICGRRHASGSITTMYVFKMCLPPPDSMMMRPRSSNCLVASCADRLVKPVSRMICSLYSSVFPLTPLR